MCCRHDISEGTGLCPEPRDFALSCSKPLITKEGIRQQPYSQGLELHPMLRLLPSRALSLGWIITYYIHDQQIRQN